MAERLCFRNKFDVRFGLSNVFAFVRIKISIVLAIARLICVVCMRVYH